MICETMAGDNRFEIIAKAKHAILEGTNIDTSEDEMKVLDNILFRCWQMGWLDKYDDSKTGWIPVSEELPKPSQRVGNGIDEDWRISSLIAMKIRGEVGVADPYEIGVAEFSLNGEFDQWYFGNDGWYDKDKVIAWKYVEPYREDGE